MPPTPAIKDLPAYLAARKELVAAREGLFSAVRAYLRPEQRFDASRLGDQLADSPARIIDEADWVANPVRGNLTVIESHLRQRPFRLRVLQQGYELRVGIRVPRGELQPLPITPFARTEPLVRYMRGSLTVDWQFEVRGLYEEVQAFEDAVFKVGVVFEAALQALVLQPTSN